MRSRGERLIMTQDNNHGYNNIESECCRSTRVNEHTSNMYSICNMYYM